MCKIIIWRWHHYPTVLSYPRNNKTSLLQKKLAFHNGGIPSWEEEKEVDGKDD